MTAVRMAAITVIVAGTALLTGGVALAAPANDTHANPTPITALPFSETLDTTTATTDADDTELNEQCGAPSTDASVWYEFTATVDGGVEVDLTASDYPAGALVGTGGPGSWTIVACGPGSVTFGTTAGETYAILVIDDQSDGGGNGGTLRLAVSEAEPPPSIDIKVEATGTVDEATGAATVGGTVVCTAGSDFALVETELRQKHGPFTVIGFVQLPLTCDGAEHTWMVTIVSENGPFGPGDAANSSFAVACSGELCGIDSQDRVVRLHVG